MEKKDLQPPWNDSFRLPGWLGMAWFCYGWWERESLLTLEAMGMPLAPASARPMPATREGSGARDTRPGKGDDSGADTTVQSQPPAALRAASKHRRTTRAAAHRRSHAGYAVS